VLVGGKWSTAFAFVKLVLLFSAELGRIKLGCQGERILLGRLRIANNKTMNIFQSHDYSALKRKAGM